MNYSKTDSSLTVIVSIDGKTKVFTTTKSNPNWDKLLVALKDNDENETIKLLSMETAIVSYTDGNIDVKDGQVFYKNSQLHGLDCQRLIEFVSQKIDYKPLVRFLERKMKNTSKRAIDELYTFLEHRGMPLTPAGTVLGYKGVGNDFYSIMGNKETVMISGQTNEGGHILNTIGADIRCDRACVCDDFTKGCSPGLHIGSLEYALSWGSKVVIVEFDPADVVSVPNDCECQKLRACAYKVVGEYTGKMNDTYSDVFNEKNFNDDDDTQQDPEDYNPDSDPFVNNDYSKDDTESNPTSELDLAKEKYNEYYEDGFKDGKAHQARLYYAVDEDFKTGEELLKIQGYNDGYKDGRFGTNVKRV